MGRDQADCRRSGERRRPRGGPSPPTAHPAAEAHAAPRERARARGSPLSTRRRDPGHVHRVPLHHGRLAVAVEHERRERGRVRRGQELRQGVERLDLPDGVREHVLLHLLATLFKLTLGMWLALLLNRHFRGKRIVRASMLLPFIVPTVLSTFAWRWMFDPTFSVLNWLLFRADLITTKLPFLSDGTYGMWCAIVVNTWRGMPFFAITLLAGLQTIHPDLHQGSSLDGANGWQRFWYVTWPLLNPGAIVVVVFSVIQTFSDFQLIYVLTGGGPANSTHLLATYAYQVGVATGLLGEGAAISLFMLPVLFVVVWLQLRYLRRMEGA